MASIFRELSLGHSKRESTPPCPPLPPPLEPPSPSRLCPTDLPSPLGDLSCNLLESELRATAYEILVAVCRTSSGKPLSYASNSPNHNHSPPLQRSLTSAAASRMKKALGLKSPGSSGQAKSRHALIVGELMRTQMRVSETVDSRIRRALLRISADERRENMFRKKRNPVFKY